MTIPVRSLCILALASLSVLSLAAGPWEPLFNGKDLTGWKLVNGTAPFTVVDGAIVGETVPRSPNSFLATEKIYGDFIFECEVKQDIGPSNSGIMFRALSTPEYKEGRVHSYQMELESGARAWAGGIYDEDRRGWLYPGDLSPASQKAYRYGEWNRVRIEAIGTTLRTWVNGQPVAHVIDAMTPRGFIALQVHSISNAASAGRRIHWRNLRIQTADLKPSPSDANFIRNYVPNTLTKAERRQGWKLLWDGKTTKGWRGAKTKGFPADGWKIENGELVVTGAKTNGLVTKDEYSAFELQLEFFVGEGGNSGIKYFLAPDAKGEPVGFEFQLLDDERHPDAKNGVDGNRTTGSLYDLVPRKPLPSGAAIKPEAGKWHHARIVARADGSVEHWLNGIKVVEFNRRTEAFKARIASSKYAAITGFGQAAKGAILLQDHGDEVKFRSIKIRKL
jgi:hypothetical protein